MYFDTRRFRGISRVLKKCMRLWCSSAEAAAVAKFAAALRANVTLIKRTRNCGECCCASRYRPTSRINTNKIARVKLITGRARVHIFAQDSRYDVTRRGTARHGMGRHVTDTVIPREIFAKYAGGFNKCKMIPKFRDES